MNFHRFSQHDSIIHRLDPRGRVAAALAISLLLAACRDLRVILGGLVVAALLCGLARLPLGPLVRRLAVLGWFMLVLALLLPLGTPGTPLATLGPLAYSAEGLLRAVAIAVKAAAIVLAYTALVSTIDPLVLGHALAHLYVPPKLVLLYFLTVRYVGTIFDEYQRLRTAMRARAFRPRTDLHTLHALGRLCGMLLVRSFDRGERVLAAMKCRAFRGTFWILDHFHFHRRDALFAAAAALVLIGLGCGEWLARTNAP